MDGRHVHNKQPPTPSAHFTFVKWAAPLWRWMGRREARGYLAEKPATWTFRLRVPRFQGLRPSARHGSRSRPAGLMVGIKKHVLLFAGTFGFGNGKINICISRGSKKFSRSFTQMHLHATSSNILLLHSLPKNVSEFEDASRRKQGCSASLQSSRPRA